MFERPTRPFLEREEQLAALRAAYQAVEAGGGGRLTFVMGEAGAGKTMLVRRFAATLPWGAVMFGACDPLETPRPLGPLLDMAPDLARRTGRPMPDPASRDDLLAFLAQALAPAAEPPVLVFEDVHWADQATVDLLRYAGRRLDRLHALVLATLRDHEVPAHSAVAVLLGDLATAGGVERLPVPPLSRAATARMVEGTGLDPDVVHERTAGNAFFVGEVVHARSDGVPPTVRDAVLTRVARLPDAARRALDAAAAIGSRVPPDLLVSVLERSGTPRWGVDEAVAAGFLDRRDDALAFRHDLARSAIAAATEPDRRQRLHAGVLAELRRRPLRDGDHVELVRHAEAAGEDATVLELAPVAAGRAAALSAHREAAALLQKAIDRAHGLPADRRAHLLERQADERYRSGQLDAAVAAHQAAARVRAEVGDAGGEARNLSRVSTLCFLAGRGSESEAARERALAVLQALPPGAELARVHEAAARVRFMEQDRSSVAWAERAEALAAGAGDGVTALEARVTAAAARLQAGDEDGHAQLEAALVTARRRGLEDIAARATLYLGWIPIVNHRYEGVEARLAEGLAGAIDRNLEYWEQLIASARVRWALDQGRWEQVEEWARQVLASRSAASMARVQALVAWGRLKARRGEADAFAVLDEALAVATEHPRTEPIARVSPARAEAAWLAGDADRVIAEAQAAAARWPEVGNPWWHGELAFWVRAAGGEAAPAVRPAPPYALWLGGDAAGASRWWQRRGCRYEAAIALLIAGDDAAVLGEALDALDRAGARPAAGYARRRLRALGVVRIPRGPRPSTLGNPARLTRREHDVLLLVAAGMSNREIAARLFLAPKTVERHLSGILRKLDAGSRLEAVSAAGRLGLLRPAQIEGGWPPS